MKSKLHFTDRLPKAAGFGNDALLIFDRKLTSYVPGFSAWAEQFPVNYSVASGETLKDLKTFPKHIERILKLTQNLSARNLTVVVAGGGSVGDFGGFIASVLKRGVKLVQVPTTWLSAIDSAHGGKTALNAGGNKNQIGTFYLASDVYLVRSVLTAQPKARAQDAFGELAKIALIDGGVWVKKLERSSSAKANDLLWKNLKSAIDAKLKVVRKDPNEKKGLRQVLNLGHTVGHVIESELKLSHGEAVAQGLFFSLAWSFRRGDLSIEDYGRARGLLENTFGIRAVRSKLKAARLRSGLLQDKKRDSKQTLTFVFLKKFGRPVRESVTVDEILFEAKEQGLVK